MNEGKKGGRKEAEWKGRKEGRMGMEGRTEERKEGRKLNGRKEAEGS